MATVRPREVFKRLRDRRAIKPPLESVLRERMENKKLGVTAIAHDNVSLIRDFILLQGSITEALWDIKGLVLQTSLITTRESLRRLNDELCLFERHGKHKVLGIAKNELSLFETPSMGRSYHEMLSKHGLTPLTWAGRLSNDYGTIYGTDYVKEFVLSPRNPLSYLLVLLASYLRHDMFGVRSMPPERNIVRAFLPLWEVNWSDAHMPVDLLFSIYAMSVLKELNNFDVQLMGDVYKHDPNVPMDNDLVAAAVLCSFIDLLEAHEVLPTEPAAKAGFQLSREDRGVLKEELDTPGALIAALGVKYVPESIDVNSMDMRVIREVSEGSMSHARCGLLLRDEDRIGVEQVWVLPSKDKAEDCRDTCLNRLSGYCEHYGLRVLVVPWVEPMAITKIWVRPEGLMSKWARTVMPHGSVLRELEADIKGLRASARPEWLDAVESLMLAWDQFRELVRVATGR